VGGAPEANEALLDGQQKPLQETVTSREPIGHGQPRLDHLRRVQSLWRGKDGDRDAPPPARAAANSGVGHTPQR